MGSVSVLFFLGPFFFNLRQGVKASPPLRLSGERGLLNLRPEREQSDPEHVVALENNEQHITAPKCERSGS
jgi:hypothetical protein